MCDLEEEHCSKREQQGQKHRDEAEIRVFEKERKQVWLEHGEGAGRC